MKFGKELREIAIRSRIESSFFVDYKNLKRRIKLAVLDRENGPAEFEEELHKEVDKIGDCLTSGMQEVNVLARSLVLRIRFGPPDTAALLKVKVSELVIRLLSLNEYLFANVIACRKIAKKFDKNLNRSFGPVILERLAKAPFTGLPLHEVLIPISEIYEKMHSPPSTGVRSVDSQTQPATSFQRVSYKFWVPAHMIVPVVLHTMQHLPLHTVGSGDPVISSIYYDDANLRMYADRCRRVEGARLLRIRSYAGSDTLFVERKVHHEPWVDTKSRKDRFSVKADSIDAFIGGTWVPSDSNTDLALVDEVRTLLSSGVRPMIRTRYNRLAFQRGGDSSVRITLDTSLQLTTQSSAQLGHWKSDNDSLERAVNFPYAILEIKLHSPETTPSWVTALMQCDAIELVPKFSKYATGCALLMSDRVKFVPYWVPQIGAAFAETLPVTPGVRPMSKGQLATLAPVGQSAVLGLKSDADTAQTDLAWRKAGASPVSAEPVAVMPPPAKKHSPAGIPVFVDSGEIDEETPLLGFARPPTRADSGIDDEGEELSDHRRSLWILLTYLLPAWMRSGIATVRRQEATGKRVIVPVRVEPKTYFANERTFLHWLSVAVVIALMAVTLIRDVDVGSARLAALIMLFAAFFFVLYALALFKYRSVMLQRGLPVRYDDDRGPIYLALTVLSGFALITVSAVMHERAPLPVFLVEPKGDPVDMPNSK